MQRWVAAVNKVLIKLLTNAETAVRRLCLPSAESRHLGAHHKWRVHDTKWFHLEIYRQRLLFPPPGLATLTCSLAMVAFEMQKGLGDAPPLPPSPILHHFPSPLQIHNALFTARKTLKVFNSNTSQHPPVPPSPPFPLSVSSTIPDCLCRGSTLMSTKLPRRQSRSKRQKKNPQMSD